MYHVSKNIKIFSLTLMVLGVLGLGFSFYSVPKTIEEAKEMEKLQIIDANMAGQKFIGACPGHYKNDAEEYYKGTFKQD